MAFLEANHDTFMDPVLFCTHSLDTPDWSPREYFLRALNAHIESVEQEWRNVTFGVEECHKQWQYQVSKIATQHGVSFCINCMRIQGAKHNNAFDTPTINRDSIILKEVINTSREQSKSGRYSRKVKSNTSAYLFQTLRVDNTANTLPVSTRISSNSATYVRTWSKNRNSSPRQVLFPVLLLSMKILTRKSSARLLLCTTPQPIIRVRRIGPYNLSSFLRPSMALPFSRL
jgi:hypothetical protein